VNDVVEENDILEMNGVEGNDFVKMNGGNDIYGSE